MMKFLKNKRFFLICSIFTWVICGEIFFAKVMPIYENNMFHGEKYNCIDFYLSQKKINRFIMGDSRSHQGLIPEVLDKDSKYKTWNFAAPGVSSPIMWCISKKLLENSSSTSIVVNVSFYLFSGTASQWLRDIYATYYNFSISDLLYFYKFHVIRLREIFPFYIRSRIPSLRHQKRLKTLLKNLNFHSIQQTAKRQKDYMLSVEREGYFSRGLVTIKDKIETKTSWNKKIHAKPYMDMLREFFVLSDKYNVDIYVYQFPYPMQYKEDVYFCDLLDFYTNLIKDQAKGCKKVHFLNNTLFYEHKYFSDNLHLNQKGSERLSTELATLINGRENNPLLLKD